VVVTLGRFGIDWLGRPEPDYLAAHIGCGGRVPPTAWRCQRCGEDVDANGLELLAPGDIPVVHVDRGGQVTYHGPGQLVVYPLVDLRRAGLAIRDFVTALERGVIDLAAQFGIRAECRRSAPGVYVEGVGGIRIEDDALVTPRGAEILTTTPREFLEL